MASSPSSTSSGHLHASGRGWRRRRPGAPPDCGRGLAILRQILRARGARRAGFSPSRPRHLHRRPLVLQLVHTPYQHASHHNPAPMEWGGSSTARARSSPSLKSSAGNRVRDQRGTGTNKGVSDKQIRLKICSRTSSPCLSGLRESRAFRRSQPRTSRSAWRHDPLHQAQSCLILAVSPPTPTSPTPTPSRYPGSWTPTASGPSGWCQARHHGQRHRPWRTLAAVVPLRLGTSRREQVPAGHRATESIREARASEAEFFGITRRTPGD